MLDNNINFIIKIVVVLLLGLNQFQREFTFIYQLKNVKK